MAKSRSSLSEGIKYIKVRYKTGKYREYDKRTIDVVLAELEKLEAKLSEDSAAEFERMIEEYMTPTDKDIQYKNKSYNDARRKGRKY